MGENDAVMEEVVRGWVMLQGVDVELVAAPDSTNSAAFHADCSPAKPKSITQGV